MPAKFLYDTSVYVDILRSRSFAEALRPDYERRVPFTYFSSVVVQELLTGTTDPRPRWIVEDLYRPFEKAGRIVTPTHQIWKEAGLLLGRMLEKVTDRRARIRAGLVNDVLIVLSAKSIGAAVVTRNRGDFALIQRFVPVRVLFL